MNSTEKATAAVSAALALVATAKFCNTMVKKHSDKKRAKRANLIANTIMHNRIYDGLYETETGNVDLMDDFMYYQIVAYNSI